MSTTKTTFPFAAPIALAGRSRLNAIGSIIAISGIAWAALAAMIAGLAAKSDPASFGPGMGLFTALFGDADAGFARALLVSLCSPFGQTAWIDTTAGQTTGYIFFLPMWLIMSVAMMLPAASPLTLAYLDIAAAAQKKNISTRSPLVLIAGYLSIWGLFALIAAAVQWRLIATAHLNEAMLLTQPVAAAGVLTVAGLYQLSPLKQACLVKCRMPMPILMAHWSQSNWGVFKLGGRQGLSCLGCCWALMAVMLVAGVMNIVWMAALAIIMLLEKTLGDPRLLTRGTGVALLGWAALLLMRM